MERQQEVVAARAKAARAQRDAERPRPSWATSGAASPFGIDGGRPRRTTSDGDAAPRWPPSSPFASNKHHDNEDGNGYRDGADDVHGSTSDRSDNRPFGSNRVGAAGAGMGVGGADTFVGMQSALQAELEALQRTQTVKRAYQHERRDQQEARVEKLRGERIRKTAEAEAERQAEEAAEGAAAAACEAEAAAAEAAVAEELAARERASRAEQRRAREAAAAAAAGSRDSSASGGAQTGQSGGSSSWTARPSAGAGTRPSASDAFKARAEASEARRRREAERMRAAGLEPPSSSVGSSVAPGEPGNVWETHERAWSNFETNPPNHITLSSIPFPESGAGLLRALVSAGKVDRKKAFHTAAMRWHPDKFTQRFGGAIALNIMQLEAALLAKHRG